MIDVLCYIGKKRQKDLFKWIEEHLLNNGFFLLSFIQNDLILKKNKNIDNWEISKKYYRIKKNNFDKMNPIKFLNFREIIDLFNKKKLKLVSSHFDISTYSKLDSSKIRIGRFVLMKKKNNL